MKGKNIFTPCGKRMTERKCKSKSLWLRDSLCAFCVKFNHGIFLIFKAHQHLSIKKKSQALPAQRANIFVYFLSVRDFHFCFFFQLIDLAVNIFSPFFVIGTEIFTACCGGNFLHKATPSNRSQGFSAGFGPGSFNDRGRPRAHPDSIYFYTPFDLRSPGSGNGRYLVSPADLPFFHRQQDIPCSST